MELSAIPASTDVLFQGIYQNPMPELSKEDNRISLLNSFMKTFEIHLNGFKFDADSPSNNFIHFSKFYGVTFMDVSFGLEETSVRIQNPQDESQIEDLHAKLFQLIDKFSFSRRKIIINRHLAVEGEVKAFLESLNPVVPKKFEAILDGRGVFYVLKIPEHQLSIPITLVNSIFVPNGLYFSVEYDFSPNKYDYKTAITIAKDYYTFILNELKLKILLGPPK